MATLNISDLSVGDWVYNVGGGIRPTRLEAFTTQVYKIAWY